MFAVQPPFDNLYKFVAVFGLIVFLYGITKSEWANKRGVAFGVIDESLQDNRQQQDRLLKLAPLVSEKERDSVLKKLLTLNDEEDSLKKQREKNALVFEWDVAVLTLIGAVMMAVGFQRWWALVQNPQDEILRIELEAKRKSVQSLSR